MVIRPVGSQALDVRLEALSEFKALNYAFCTEGVDIQIKYYELTYWGKLQGEVTKYEYNNWTHAEILCIGMKGHMGLFSTVQPFVSFGTTYVFWIQSIKLRLRH